MLELQVLRVHGEGRVGDAVPHSDVLTEGEAHDPDGRGN